MKMQYLVEHIEAVAYVIAGNDEVTIEQFYQILAAKGVAKKIVEVLREVAKSEMINREDLMSFILTSTLESGDLSESMEHSIEKLKMIFEEHLGKNNQEITLEEFKKIIPAKGKEDFFINQVFNIFDQDSSGTISLTEFIETIRQYSRKDDESKIEFLFRIYDVDGDGVITEDEFCQVLTACMKENGLEFDKNDLSNLAHLLFIDGVKEGSNQMTLDGFYDQLLRQEGLVEGLGIMINKWFVPYKKEADRSILHNMYCSLSERYLSKEYWVNNKAFLLFLLLITIINLVLFILRGYYFRNFCMLSGFTPNMLYVLSRACGRTLLFNSILVLVLVLRNSITFLRQVGLSSFLPLDSNIYFHKVVGVMIFFQSAVHTVMHLANFAINIQPNPVKLVQLSYKYWADYYGEEEVFSLYNVPPGCTIVDSSSPDATNCIPGSLDIPDGVNPDMIYNNGSFLCQSCNEGGHPWTYADWMLTMKPNMFGLIHGIANITGIVLMCILTIMFICSLPFVRRRGHFEIFYFTHLLYVAYYVLLLLHAPEFWKWFLPVGVVWVVERLYRMLHAMFGHGKTVIRADVILPSKVTNLVIERPAGFTFTAGDWVRVRIPALAWNEWHPFTISSAPEVRDHLTLHIRGVGEWTNSLYTFFQTEFERQKAGRRKKISTVSRTLSMAKQRAVNISRKKKISAIENSFASTFVTPNRIEENHQEDSENTKESKLRISRSFSRTVSYDNTELQEVKSMKQEDAAGKTHLETPLNIYIDGPFGSPSSDIYQSEHAVLIGTGIGVTPFSSILQSIMHSYRASKQTCPHCQHQWTSAPMDIFKLKKVDFFWINRDQKSFEWFVHLLSQLEVEQADHEGGLGRFLEMHMYVTSALHKTDMKAVALQLALDILHKKEDRDLVTGLKARTNAGRPNWEKVFTKLRQENAGQVTIFYCGNPVLGRVLRYKSEEFGFKFKKEVF